MMPASAQSTFETTAGLMARETGLPVALEGVHVDADVNPAACRVVVRQRYRNREASPLELVYVFPLDEGAAVCGFEATVDGVRHVGQVKPCDEAFIDYDEAMANGHGAFLLDEERPDVFQASLGNVPPGASVELAITYVAPLAAEGAGVRFTLPTTVSPRYAPRADRTGIGPTPAETLNPPREVEVPYRLTFDMRVEMRGEVTRIESPTHPITVERQGCLASVRLTQRDAAMDRDLVIVIDAAGLDEPQTIVEQSPAGTAAAVTFMPRFESASLAAEVIFLIDRSGSMTGTSMAEVKNALQLCLASLTPGCRFDIVGFGDRPVPLFGSTRPYDETSLESARAHVVGLEADLGGTEILRGLEHVFERPRVEGLARQVVLLTDGEVTNTDAVIALARKHASHARVFTFGIGAGASAHLVNAVARATGGAAEFIAPGERIEPKVLRQFRRVLAPALTDIRVEWPEGVRPAPSTPPAVFDGERLVHYGLADAPPSGRVLLTGQLRGEHFETDVEIGDAVSQTVPTVGVLAARARVRELEEQPDYLSVRGSRQQRPRSGLDAAGEITRLSMAFGLSSRETSFVVVEHRETPVTDAVALRRIPTALTSGWGGQRRWPAPLAVVPTFAAGRASLADIDTMDASYSFVECRALECEAVVATESVQPTTTPPHVLVVSRQRADGSWDLDAVVSEAIGLDVRWAESVRDDALSRLAGADERTRERTLVTAMVLAWLEDHAAAARDEWIMASEKAHAWLATSGVVTVGGVSWVEVGRTACVQAPS